MRRALGIAALVTLSGPALDAQNVQPTLGEISGRVIDASTDAPLDAAHVVLSPLPSGLLMPSESSSAFRARSLSVTTDSDGRYRFSGLGSGAYEIRVERIGYRTAVVSVELHGAASSRVTLGLQVDPIELEPIDVALRGPGPMNAQAQVARESDPGRLRLVEERQDRFLEGDVRSLGYGQVMEAVTLGEVDIFRALQRLPGVATRDDFTAELWTRGASWGRTRAYFDEIPLFNPLHAGGMFSGVSPESVGSVFFMPGARSATIGEGAAGVVRLTSRPAQERDSKLVSSEISLLSGRVLAEDRFRDGKLGFAVTGRRSWWDLATRAVGDGFDPHWDEVNYKVSGWSGQADYVFSDRTRLVGSWLSETDDLQGNIPSTVEGSRGTWGNSVERVTLETPFFGAPARFTIGTSSYAARVVPDAALPLGDPDPDVVVLDAGDTEIDYSVLRAEISNTFRGSTPGRWTLGGEWVEYRLRQGGSFLPINAHRKHEGLSRGSLDLGSVFGEIRLAATRQLDVRIGARVESGDPVMKSNGRARSDARLAPSVSLRYRAAPGLTTTAAWTRSYQYTQSLGNAGTPFGPQLFVGQTWTLAGGDVPPAQADVVTGGAEYWLGGGWLGSATVWGRKSIGLTVREPRPGYLLPSNLPGDPAEPWVAAEEEAGGIELGVRKLTGRVTGSAGYSYTEARIEAAGLRFDSEAARPHVVDASLMARARDNLRLGAAFTAATGVAYTRTFRRYCHDWPTEEELCPEPATGPTTFQESPNAERGRTYASLDLLLDWTKRRSGWTWGMYVQVRNVLGRHNPGAYTGSDCREDRFDGTGCTSPALVRDDFEDGFTSPFPFIGFKMTF